MPALAPDRLARRALGLALDDAVDVDAGASDLAQLCHRSPEKLARAIKLVEQQSPEGPVAADARAMLQQAARQGRPLGSGLRISLQPVGTEALIRLDGELCPDAAPQLAAVLTELIESGHHSITLDLQDLTLLTAHGVSLVLTARHHCQDTGGSLALTNPQGIVATVLDLCQVPLTR